MVLAPKEKNTPGQVQVVFDPEKVSLVDILRWFWEAHDPTQGMGQGNDRGTQRLGKKTTQLSANKCSVFSPPSTLRSMRHASVLLLPFSSRANGS